MKEITINDVNLNAMVDSGSDLNFMASRKLRLIGRPEVENMSTSFLEWGMAS